MIQLTRHFNLSEFIVSADRPDLAALIAVSDVQRERMRCLAAFILEPVRRHFGLVKILSGIRSPELNAAIGGAKNSDHLYRANSGAVDFTVPGIDDHWDVFTWMRLNTPVHKQLIIYPTRRFIHVSCPDDTGRYAEAREWREGNVYVPV